MHGIPVGSDFRPHDDYSISLPSVGQHLMLAFSLAHCGSAGFLALTVSEWRSLFFVSLQYDYMFDGFPVVVHWISMEASKRV